MKPAGGAGWGGEAKGPGKDLSDPATHAERLAITPEMMRERAKEKVLLAEEALGTMVTIMRESEYEANRLNAASKVRAEVIGLPKQRVELGGDPDGVPIEVSDRDRAKAIAALLAKARQA